MPQNTLQLVLVKWRDAISSLGKIEPLVETEPEQIVYSIGWYLGQKGGDIVLATDWTPASGDKGSCHRIPFGMLVSATVLGQLDCSTGKAQYSSTEKNQPLNLVSSTKRRSKHSAK
jgi:hypothetical protein